MQLRTFAGGAGGAGAGAAAGGWAFVLLLAVDAAGLFGFMMLKY